jgi:major membrane immunogen (membrane-anchored lipoprotein)
MKKVVSLPLGAAVLLALIACGPREGTAAREEAPAEGKAGQVEPQTYRAENDGFDEFGWKGQIVITVQGNDITEVQFDEVNQQGQLKRNDEQYTAQMQASSGITPAEASDRLVEQLVQKDSPDQVDVVTGATGTSQRFIELARQALPE